MATNSLIARHNRDGSFDSIQVHYGHPDWIGPVLMRHYTDEVRVNSLLALGSLSHLDREVGQKHAFDQPHPGWCIAYGRDREQENTEARRSESLPDLVQRARALFSAHLFVWAVNPQTGEKAWATVPMPEETEASVRALIETVRQGGGTGPMDLPVYRP